MPGPSENVRQKAGGKVARLEPYPTGDYDFHGAMAASVDPPVRQVVEAGTFHNSVALPGGWQAYQLKDSA
jgi:hypothetical protein